MRLISVALICAAMAPVFGCSGKSKTSSTPGTSTSPTEVAAVGEHSSAPADHPSDEPAVFSGFHKQLDLLALAHLADVDHHGLFIDFGTPARMKYTVGNWRTGWGSDKGVGSTTYSQASSSGRVYFNVDHPGPLTLRFRVKAFGTKNMQLFINGKSLESAHFEEGSEFKDYDVRVPAEAVIVGENHLLLRFGGTTPVEGESVSVGIDSLRVISGEPDASSFSPPLYTDLVTEMRVGSVQRRALALRVPTTISYYIEVPAKAKLGFGVGAEGDAPVSATAKVVVTAEGSEPTEVFSRAITKQWSDATVSLERFAGQVVRIDLKAEGEGGAGRVGFSTPAVLVPDVATPSDLPNAKNAIILLVDTLRADHLSPWNPKTRVKSPAMEAFASESTIFMNAQAPENWTKPSVASVLTSLWPATHRAKTDDAKLPAAAEMLSEVFKEAGFATGGFIGNGFVSDRFGFAQGWDHYTNYIRENKDTKAATIFREAGDWIEQHKSERFFAYVQTIDPHVPYDPPQEYLDMYDPGEYTGQVTPRMTPDLLEKAKRNPPLVTFDERDRRRLEGLYDGEISYHDHAFGEFIERLKRIGVYEDTVFVVVADHGEELNDHGSWGHGHTVYQELLHVPLAVHQAHRVPAGQKIEATVTTVDIGPTIYEATGVAINSQAEGHSLQPYFRGDLPSGPAVAFSDFLDDRRVIRAGRWKLILRGLNPTLFDLNRDAGEQHELEPKDRPVAMRYCRILLGQFLGATDRHNWLNAVQALHGSELRQETIEIDPTLRDQLQALGYAAGTKKEPATPRAPH